MELDAWLESVEWLKVMTIGQKYEISISEILKQ